MLFACGGDQDRYEDIQKMRALGVLSDKAVVEPSTASAPQTVSLTFYAALPHGDSVTAATYTDDAGSSGGTPAAVVLDQSSAGVDTHASFNIYHIKGVMTVPGVEALAFKGLDQNATVQYGVKLDSAANGTQIILGNVVVYPSGAEQLKTLGALPTVKITAPAKAAALSDGADISADVATTNSETVRIGWFITGGQIKNRNAAATHWDPKDIAKGTNYLGGYRARRQDGSLCVRRDRLYA